MALYQCSSDLNFEFARVKVLLLSVFQVAAPVTLAAGGRHFVVFVREDWLSEESLCTVFPVTDGSGVAGGFSIGEDGISDEEGWAKDVGDYWWGWAHSHSKRVCSFYLEGGGPVGAGGPTRVGSLVQSKVDAGGPCCDVCLGSVGPF